MVATLDEFATSVDNFSYCQQEGTDLFFDPVAILLGQDRPTAMPLIPLHGGRSGALG